MKWLVTTTFQWSDDDIYRELPLQWGQRIEVIEFDNEQSSHRVIQVDLAKQDQLNAAQQQFLTQPGIISSEVLNHA